MSSFNLVSDYVPTGDQPQAIEKLVLGLKQQLPAQTLLGVTGSGKTFTIANVIKNIDRPTLILSHNKTLAGQLYAEFKNFFPDNAVEYFVSYYDYYQPEAYIPSSGKYIEKDLSINQEIEKLRLRTTSTLLSGRRDVVVVSSVSCIYGMGNPSDFKENIIYLKQGQIYDRNQFLYALVQALYSRVDNDEIANGKFKVKGDVVIVFPAFGEVFYRIHFENNRIEKMEMVSPSTKKVLSLVYDLCLYPATIFVTTKDTLNLAVQEIQLDMGKQVEYFKSIGKHLEATRIEDRVIYDLEMMRELGYCSGIENYSRYFDRRKVGERPFCLLDYFPEDFLMVIDESHVTVSQVSAMYGGDRARKENLVEYGFRLPSAMDNRPLKKEEFESLLKQTIYVSATPADYELQLSGGAVVEQIIRPTGLLDPIIEVRPTLNQIDDLLEEINQRSARNERVLITTLTKVMAEEMQRFFEKMGIRSRYIHSDVETLERIEILIDLRKGVFDVLVGVNLLREGLDLPEVSLVAIMDADKEGFLRSERSLTQTVGRAARNVNGFVVMYADKITESMRKTIDETKRRREIQQAYNKAHNLVPKALKKYQDSSNSLVNNHADYNTKIQPKQTYADLLQQDQRKQPLKNVAEPASTYYFSNKKELLEKIKETETNMNNFVSKYNFKEAAIARDLLFELQGIAKNFKD